jgi:succinate dehydrogenase / fumarate reductase, flavoprotein subunit
MIELENMLNIGESMAAAALEREETRGAHYRTDFPKLDPTWCANLIVARQGNRLIMEKASVVGPEATIEGVAAQ